MTDKYTIEDVKHHFQAFLMEHHNNLKPPPLEEYDTLILKLINQAYEDGRKDEEILIFKTWSNDNEGLILTIKDLKKENEELKTATHNAIFYSNKCIELEKEFKILENLNSRQHHEMNRCQDLAAIRTGEKIKLEEENKQLKEYIKQEVDTHTENMISWAQKRDALQKELQMSKDALFIATQVKIEKERLLKKLQEENKQLLWCRKELERAKSLFDSWSR